MDRGGVSDGAEGGVSNGTEGGVSDGSDGGDRGRVQREG